MCIQWTFPVFNMKQTSRNKTDCHFINSSISSNNKITNILKNTETKSSNYVTTSYFSLFSYISIFQMMFMKWQILCNFSFISFGFPFFGIQRGLLSLLLILFCHSFYCYVNLHCTLLWQ